MSFPSPLYCLLKGGSYLTLEDVIAETREDILNTDQSNYRDTMDAAFQGYNVQLQNAAGVPGNGFFPPTAGPPKTLTGETDEYTHTPPRNTFSKRTMIRWWQAGGASIVFSGTTVAASPVVVVGSINRLYSGMDITGTGIPAGAIIQEVRTVLSSVGVVSFAIVLSLNATASATVSDLTSTAPVGDLAGECWADRFIGWSAEIPQRQ